MGRFASRIWLQAHRQEILVVQPSQPDVRLTDYLTSRTLESSLTEDAALGAKYHVSMQNLKQVTKELLTEFVRANSGKKPSRIIFYRDGVSEGQFRQVIRHPWSSGL